MRQDFVYEFSRRALRSNFILDGLPSRGALFNAGSLPTIFVTLEGQGKPPATIVSEDSFIWTDPNATLSVHKNGELYGLIFPDLALFTLDADMAHIRIYSRTDEATMSHLLLDQVLPRLLAWSGETIIHAGAITAEGNGIAFLGESGHGKSSMTAGFVQSGAQLLSDDAVALRLTPDGVYAAGLYPSLRLWPRALDGLSVAKSKTSDMAHYSTKRRVHIDDVTVKEPHKLNAIFKLNMGDADSDISLTPLSQREIMMTLIEGSFRLDPTAQPQGQNFFNQIDILKNHIKGYKLCYPRGYEHLPVVRAAITAHLKETA